MTNFPPRPAPKSALWLALAIWIGASASVAPAWAGEGTLYAGPEQDPVFGDIAPELVTALFPGQRFKLQPQPSTAAALDHVAADPAAAAVADLASTLDYAARHALPPERLEFSGELAHRCLLVFTQRGGWLHSFADLTAAAAGAAAGAPRPSLGLAGADPAVTLALLQRFDPGLAGLDVQAGTPAQLAARVARGQVDALLLVAYPELDQSTIDQLMDNAKLTRLPAVTRLLALAAAGPDSGFTLSTAASAGSLLPWKSDPEPTLCTPVGVVTRDDAAAALREALPAAGQKVAAVLRKPSLTEHAYGAARGAVHDAFSAMRGWLGTP